ncbi:hypothetical protein MLD38_030016 [Melastoma candidum]|uniref:Uncharacterized protein n=1 Tax=Melastoma candidum TaxID=119954 RepID=A0ACB9MKJ5_9MYRT|nr:hypothetical protein MLD38_030016 [Melastoma candidum]
MLLKRWSLRLRLRVRLRLRLTAGSARFSLRFAAETLSPPAVEPRRLLPWLKPRPAPSPPLGSRPRKRKLLPKICFLGCLRKFRLFRRGAVYRTPIYPADDEDGDGNELRRSIYPLLSNARKAAAAAASLWAAVMVWMLSERLRRWCHGDGWLAGQWPCISTLLD